MQHPCKVRDELPQRSTRARVEQTKPAHPRRGRGPWGRVDACWLDDGRRRRRGRAGSTGVAVRRVAAGQKGVEERPSGCEQRAQRRRQLSDAGELPGAAFAPGHAKERVEPEVAPQSCFVGAAVAITPGVAAASAGVCGTVGRIRRRLLLAPPSGCGTNERGRPVGAQGALEHEPRHDGHALRERREEERRAAAVVWARYVSRYSGGADCDEPPGATRRTDARKTVTRVPEN